MGQLVAGSVDTDTEGTDTAHVTTMGVHDCPHCGSNMVVSGSPDDITNNQPTARVGDSINEFCGTGVIISGAPTVNDNG
jgi:uncharacterized Zn-binding protein involved in type VI secretion